MKMVSIESEQEENELMGVINNNVQDVDDIQIYDDDFKHESQQQSDSDSDSSDDPP